MDLPQFIIHFNFHFSFLKQRNKIDFSIFILCPMTLLKSIYWFIIVHQLTDIWIVPHFGGIMNKPLHTYLCLNIYFHASWL